MGEVNAPIVVQNLGLPQLNTVALNFAQNTGTYTLRTATGGGIWVKSAAVFVSTLAVGTGMTAAIQSSNTVPDPIMAATAAASLLAGKNVAAITTPFWLPSGATINLVIAVANGTGGAGTLVLEFIPSPGATLV